jgi:transcriptional regulator GlxA family with amidase domain
MTLHPRFRPSPAATGRPRRVVLVAFPGVASLDITGPASVFSTAEYFRPGSYRVEVATPHGGDLLTNSGLWLGRTLPLTRVRGAIDTLLVAGGDEPALRSAVGEHGVAEWMRAHARAAHRVGSVCTGAFILAAAGLLEGRRATTHWRSCELLAALSPTTRLEPDAIFVADRGVYTSAGVTAGIDLALALVESDLGRALAAEVARELVVFLRRPGGQSQFSAGLKAQSEAHGTLGELIVWMVDHPREDLSIPALARRAHLSERHFSRVFTREIGRSPARFVESLRLERARQHLEETSWGLSRIAEESGFGSEDALSQAFRRTFGTTPGSYRARFA